MDIFIKSFNRAFYLDRCLKSIKSFVEGSYTVTVLDDGTPEKYLNKIKEKHPHIEILKSKNYNNKTSEIAKNLETGKEIDGFTIPTDLWIEATKNASDYFIMTEDDVWFTQKINVDELQKTCKKNKISLLKLGWLGNHKDFNNVSLEKITEKIESAQPQNLILFPGFLNDWFFYNKYKFFTLLYKLGIANNSTKQKYWALNSILMGLWDKQYWLYIWKDAKGKVDEKQQLRNATAFYKKNKGNPNFIAKLKTEVMKTTFQSSATNSYHQYGNDFDVNKFNFLMNEVWLRGEFDEMEGFPKDFSLDYFERFFDDKINRNAFNLWVEKFKTQYKNIGCEIE